MTAVTTEANTDVAWGAYEPAIRRWEAILERRARLPVEPGRAGRPRLAPRFVEWLMGLDDGWVTNLELPRTAQLRILGNGFVPQQADHAITLLLRQASRPRVAPNRRTSADQSRMSRPRARLRESDDSHQAQDELDTTGRQERPSMQPSEPQAPAKASAGGWEPTQRPKEQQTLCMPSRKSIGTKIPGSLPPTVEWTAVDDEHRYHRLLVIIFGRAEATLSQVRGQQDDDERRSTPDEEHRDQDRRTQEAA
jgi:DNA (cytosine-5)-methyltransferase 1